MIDRAQLLPDLQTLLRKLEADLLERCGLAAVEERLRSEYGLAQQAERTAQSFEEWRSDSITQMAVAWVLSAVFVRFLEDNQLIDPPVVSGSGERLQRSRDEHELYFQSHPQETDREYWLWIFARLAKLPGLREIFGEKNRIGELPGWLSGDAAGELLRFFQRVEPATGRLVHDFTDEQWNTRFLGDLYQDLSEAARKKFALLQTPDFVESFILDRTLDPAIAEFGLPGFRLIDPACGSGHFLLGALERLLERWLKQEPGTNVRELVQRSLDSIHGVDINSYAVAIARFRLLVVAMRASGITKLRDAPGFRMQLACGDSLLHGEGTQLELEDVLSRGHHYQGEDIAALNRILLRGHYHAVVANPPYIVPKDAKANEAYRKLYQETCYRQYSLAVPFFQRMYSLAVAGGFTGQITANSFMKREFGKKLIENFVPHVDLTHVIDTSGAYIPGHGTPTVILFGRNRQPVAGTIRTVMGIRGEPSTPGNPAEGLVWSAILQQVDCAGSQSEFVSVADSVRASFCKHPWSIGGGGASDLKLYLDDIGTVKLSNLVSEIGFMLITGEDNCLLAPISSSRRVPGLQVMPVGDGEIVRDWSCTPQLEAIWTCDSNAKRLEASQIESTLKYLWAYRTLLKERKAFGVPVEQKGIPWWANREVYADKICIPKSIAFAFVATHNHFVLDRGGKVFKQSAPVIKLPADATEEDHLALLGLLNSSTACFWMKQVFHNKGSTSDSGVLQADPEKFRFEFDGSKLRQFPIASLELSTRQKLIDLAKALDQRGCELSSLSFADFVTTSFAIPSNLESELQEFLLRREKLRCEMVRLQEELDWLCYEIYGLLPESSKSRSLVWSHELDQLPPLIPDHRPYRVLVSSNEVELNEIELARIQLIQNDSQIRLIEVPDYKRRWFRSAGAYDDTNLDDSILLQRGLLSWLLDRLETYFDFDGRMNPEAKPTHKIEPALISLTQLTDLARQDPPFLQVAELYRNDPSFNLQKLITELVEAESIPLLPILRYKPTGLRKRTAWEHTWEKQRQEDAIDNRTQLPKDHPDYLDLNSAKTLKQTEVGTIPVPPKYTSTDFQKSHYWRLRGKLDVPKERWISFPHSPAEDGTLTIAWAGYDHLQLALAISTYFVEIQEHLGGRDDPRLLPLLASLLELLPWLKQWHNHLDPTYNQPMGDYIEAFLQDEARQIGKTLEDVRSWQPPAKTNRRR